VLVRFSMRSAPAAAAASVAAATTSPYQLSASSWGMRQNNC
jgi:hypothetical protein